MKRALALILALLLVASLISACDAGKEPTKGPETPDQTTAPGTDKPQESGNGGGDLEANLVMWAMPLTDNFESMLTDDLIAGLNESEPGVSINVEMLTWEGGPEKLQIALGTKTTPDLYIDGTARTAALPAKGVLADISDVIDAYRDRFYPGLLQIGLFEDKNYILSIAAMNATIIGVNATVAKDLGTYDMLPEDKVSWSFDDFYNFLKATSDAGKDQGIYAVALYAGSPTSDIGYYSMMLSNGGGLLNDDHTESVANQAANVEIIELLKRLVDEGIAAPGAATLKSEDHEPMVFSSKIVTTVDGNPFYWAQVLRQMEEDGSIEKCPEYEAYGMPTPDGKRDMRVASWGANTMVLFQNEGDQAKLEGGKALMRHYIEDTDFQIELCSLTGNSPSLQNLTVPQTDPNFQLMVPLLAEWTGKYAVTDFGVLEPYWLEIRSTFYPELQAVFNGTKSPQEAMDQFKASIDDILAEQ